MELSSQHEYINTNQWIQGQNYYYTPVTVNKEKLNKYSRKLRAWRGYQIVLKED